MSELVNFFGELGAGVFEEKLTRSIKETALACMANNKKGEIVLKFTVTPINQSQAKVTHAINTKAPTLNGEKAEKNSTETHMYVNKGGSMSLFPENQTQMFTPAGKIHTNKTE